MLYMETKLHLSYIVMEAIWDSWVPSREGQWVGFLSEHRAVRPSTQGHTEALLRWASYQDWSFRLQIWLQF